jgi:iron complex transport system substrate-binding protein
MAKPFVVEDDLGNKISLDKPAERIVSLAPHLTEILFSLDVGDKIVGTVKYSDFPEQALDIPRLGDAFSLNVEAIVAMRPDIIFAWHTGGASESVQRLADLGIPVFINHSQSLSNISSSFVQIGKLVGKQANGLRLKSQFDEKLSQLASQRVDRPVIFFQISDQDLYSVSDRHIIGKTIHHCGGKNLFSEMLPSVSLVSLEAVIAGAPDLIFVTQSQGESPWAKRWQKYSQFKGRISAIDPGVISRPSFRMLEGIKGICEQISSVDTTR